MLLLGVPGAPLMACVPMDITVPGDPVQPVGSGPDERGPDLAIDDDPNTIFNVVPGGGLRVTPVLTDSKIVALKVKATRETLNSAPLEYELYGAKRDLDGPYAWIASGALDYVDEIPLGMSVAFPTAMVTVAPSARYDHYQILFPLARDEGPWIQVAEVELFNDCEIFGPTPKDLADDVPRESLLNWTPWHDDLTYDVYLGTEWSDVNQAERDHPVGLLVSLDQGLHCFDPNGLAWGTTYYWRVDEVNSVPDVHIARGSIWSFTSEPYAYPVEGITATASGLISVEQGPARTIDYSGLNVDDEHSTSPDDMWSAPLGDSWIQYEFDQTCLLESLWVWNSNSTLESVLGLGVKDATIETSLDGVTWSTVPNVPPFAQGTGSPNYTPNTTIDLSGVIARYVKIVPQSTYKPYGHVGLSEVRFFIIPTVAQEPQPVDGAVGLDPNQVTLSWRPGRQADLHAVYWGTDPNALTWLADVNDSWYGDVDMLDLEPGQTYYWKVNEVNETENPSTWEGPVWSFSTEELF